MYQLKTRVKSSTPVMGAARALAPMHICTHVLKPTSNQQHNMQKVQSLQPTRSVYVALARPAKRWLGRVAVTSLRSRWVTATSRSRQNIAPSMEQFRQQSSYKNTTTAYGKKLCIFRIIFWIKLNDEGNLDTTA